MHNKIVATSLGIFIFLGILFVSQNAFVQCGDSTDHVNQQIVSTESLDNITTAVINEDASKLSKLEKAFARVPANKLTAQVGDNSGVKFTLNSAGVQSLSYNGQSFITKSNYDMIATSFTFKAPDGTVHPYGWTEGAEGADRNLSVGSSVKSTGSNPDYFEQIYRQGKADSFTLKMVWTAPDTRTAKVDIYVTNNDPTDTLSKFSLEYFLGSGTQHFLLPDIGPYNYGWFNIYNQSPTLFVRGINWGSVAMYTDNYNTASYFGDVWTNESSNANPNPYNMLFVLKNFYSPGGAASNMRIDPVLPGQTWHYALYIRFGSVSDTASTLAPEAYTAYRNSFPYLVNWSDRRPITRWFIGDGARNSATNPRSYLWDDKVDVVPLTDEKQVVFNTRLLKLTDDIVTRMDKMDPKPQGIIIWDLEGDEFSHYLTYVGNPNKLPDLAPEMNAVADQMFKKFTDAGYNVGMTLRPSNLMTGTTLPATCTTNADTDLRDVFIKTDAVYPNRGYACTATNTWTQPGARNPWYQTCSHDDSVILNTLRSKVSYAKSRWGAKMFYVDSTVYCGGGGGNSFNAEIFRQLQKDFPDVIFFPENEGLTWWGSGAPYNQVNTGTYDTWSSAKEVYPQAFSVLANYDNVNFADPATRNKLVQSVRNGNIFMIDAWFNNPTNEKILQVYRDARDSGYVISPPTTGGTKTTTETTVDVIKSVDTSSSVTTPQAPAPAPDPPPASGSTASSNQTSNTSTGSSGSYVTYSGSGGTGYVVTGTNSVSHYGSYVGTIANQSQNSVVSSQTWTSGSGSSLNYKPKTAIQPVIVAINRNLKLNDQGEDVRFLQKTLNSSGYSVASTGPDSVSKETIYFDTKTSNALKKYQVDHASTGLNSTGILDNATLTLINSEASRLARNADKMEININADIATTSATTSIADYENMKFTSFVQFILNKLHEANLRFIKYVQERLN